MKRRLMAGLMVLFASVLLLVTTTDLTYAAQTQPYTSNADISFFGTYEYPKKPQTVVPSKPVPKTNGTFPQTGAADESSLAAFGGALIVISTVFIFWKTFQNVYRKGELHYEIS